MYCANVTILPEVISYYANVVLAETNLQRVQKDWYRKIKSRRRQQLQTVSTVLTEMFRYCNCTITETNQHQRQ